VLSSACAAGLAAVVCPLGWGTLPAQADPDDGTITVLVARDVDGSGDYTPEVDEPQSGVSVTVTDAGGRSVSDTSDEAGLVVVEPTDELSGGRYFVTAEIPEELGMTAVPAGGSFAPMSSTVDVTSESQTVRLGVTVRAEPAPTTPPVPQPRPQPPPVPAPSAPPAPRFAVGDRVWRDLDGDGKQDASEPAASRTSVQLLGSKGTVLDTTTTDRDGRYVFDDLPAGTYSVRFAGVPSGSRFTRAGSGVPSEDSDPDFSGVTPSFTLGVGQPNVRRTSAGDGVRADYVNPTVDAGVAALRYAVGSVVWQDDNGDGLLEPGEPAAQAQIALLDHRGAEVRTTRTDDEGRFLFADLAPGSYRLRFSDLGDHRQLTARRVGGNAATSSAADPETGTTESFQLKQGASGLIPAADFGDVDADFVRAALNVGTVGSYSIADRVWRDTDANGVRDPDEPGVRGVRVQLLDGEDVVVASTTTDRGGRFAFDRLTAGSYRLRFLDVPDGLFFTAPGRGDDRGRDSDVLGGASTAVITVGVDHPVEDQVAAGLTTSAAAATAGGQAPRSVVDAPVVTPGAVPVTGGTALPWAVGGGLVALGAALGSGWWLRRRRSLRR
jgi:5-hydroxyisourate hydrolase-like protein (transthyretin family)